MSATPSARRFLITGAAGGIGGATAIRLAQGGAWVALIGRRAAALEDAAARCRAAGGQALALAADVAREEQVAAALDAVGKAWGGLDGLVSNAGAVRYAAVDETTLAAWNELLAVNLTGAFLVVRSALPLLRSGRAPAIVMVGSTLGLRGLPRAAAYCAAKAGLINFARALALEWAPLGVRVNVVCPGAVDTSMLDAERGDGRGRDERIAELAALHPLGRIAAPAEVAAVIEQLLAPEASFVTGAVVVVDGGQTAGFAR